jgi:P-type Ca2+ transporter type 2B
VFLIVSITAGNNYVKERQFRKLQRKLDEFKVHVVRAGTHQDIDAKDVVVGDILQF